MMAERNSTQPQVPTVEDMWEIIQAQQELLSRYHSVTEETRLWAHGEKIELPQFARFDPEVSDRHGRLSSLVNKAYAAMVFMKTAGSMPIRVSRDLLEATA